MKTRINSMGKKKKVTQEENMTTQLGNKNY